MTDDDLMAMVRTIHIGAHRQDIDRLADQSNGMLSAKSLTATLDNKNWPYPQKRPCILRFDQNDRVSFLRFDGGAVNIPGLDPDADLESLRKRFPGHTDRFQTSPARALQRVSLILGHDEHGAAIQCDFVKGRLTGVSFWSADSLAAQEEQNREFELKHVRDTAQAVAKLAKDKAHRAAHAAWRRSAPPDDVLRHWAKSYSAWGESPDAWGRFVDWLIEDSSAIDRHLVMQAYNWDHGVEIPNWIVQQPDTQMATVLNIFWLAEPSYYVGLVARNEAIPDYHEGHYEMLLQIGKNVASGFYKTPWPWQKIAFACTSRVTWNMSDPDVVRAAKLLVPDNATLPIKGKDASTLAKVRALPFDPKLLT